MADTEPRDDFEEDPGFLLADGTPAFPDLDSNVALPETGEGDVPIPDEFEPDVQADIQSLLINKYISSSFSFAGHDFTMRTLLFGEELAAALVTKRYEGTLGEGKSLMGATVAIAIASVDGAPLTRALGPGHEETIQSAARNFHYVTRKWAWPIVEVLYTHYSDLKIREHNALVALEGKSAAGRPTS